MRDKIYLGILILVSLLVSNCNPSTKTFGTGNGWIPKEFDPKNTILLVEGSPRYKKQDQKMRDYMAEKYPYKFEFATAEAIKSKSGKYANTKLYKYALASTSHTDSYRYTNGSPSNLKTTDFDFFFYDREKEIKYPNTGRSSSYQITTFKPVINTILKERG